MKKYILPLFFSLISFAAFSQKGISYQAIILDPNPIEAPGVDIAGQPLVNGEVWMKFSIYNGSVLQFEEIHKTKTDAYGLVSLLIGSVSPATFNKVVWDANQKNMQVFASFNQGGSYTKVSEQKLVYTPYALFSETAGKLGGTLAITGGGTGATSLADARVNLGVDKVDNTPDAVKPISAAVQAALDLKANSAEVTAALTLKANAADFTAALAAKADTGAIKTYVDNRLASGNFTSTQSSTATITDADATTKGKIQLAGDLGGTAAAPTVPGLALKANVTDVTTALALKAPIASPSFTGTVSAPIYASTPQTLTDASTIAWNPSLGLNASVTLGGNRTLSFTATPATGSYGTLVLTQDATGGRTITLPSTTNKVLGSTSSTTIDLSTAANAIDIVNFYYDGTNYYWNIGQGYGQAVSSGSTNLASDVTGTLAIANGGTGATTAAAARTNLGLVIGTTVQAPLVAGTDYLAPNGSAANLTNFPTLNQNTTGNAATATLATTATSATIAGNITATSNTTLTSLSNLITVGTITSGTWSGTAIAVTSGGTGATNAAAARTNLGLVIGTNVQAPLIAGTDYQAPITLTTTGTGAATFSGTTLNIPTPSSGSSNTHSVGESYGGGVVFYTWDNDNHGLIVSTDDVSSVTQSAWPGNATIERIKPILANNNGLLAGKELTRTLVYYALTASGITNLPTSNIAAYLCYQYRGGNFSDWYLPSAYELDLLWQNRNVVANLASTWNSNTTKYWSSTLSYTDGGVNVQFYLINYLGQTNGNAAYDAHRVRAIRSF